ncbi:hypothetical protein BC835DRAFT_1310906 [Cytidiella melzeri]|nr:hypothetical protein BC835DRAFT_1310906 [Cytidiella melzeri]
MHRHRFNDTTRKVVADQQKEKKLCPGCQKVLGCSPLFEHRRKNCGQQVKQQKERFDTHKTPVVSESSNANGKRLYNTAFQENSDTAGGSRGARLDNSGPADEPPPQGPSFNSGNPATSPGVESNHPDNAAQSSPAMGDSNNFPFAAPPGKESHVTMMLSSTTM